MTSIKDEKGFNQSFKKSIAQEIRLHRRFDYMINQMDSSQFHRNTKVLEIGCAEGDGLNYLVNKINVTGVGIDISQKFIDVATQNYKSETLTFQVVDFNDSTSFTGEMKLGTFDYVIGNGILHHLYYNIGNSLLNLHRLLKPGGKIIFIEPNIYNPYVALIFKIPYLRKKTFLEPDEMAFSAPFIRKQLKAAKFSSSSTEIKDFLLPNTPKKLINTVIKLGAVLEKTPFTAIAQSIFITATK